jgi:diguanylate cyclase (GGDEF)-like protein
MDKLRRVTALLRREVQEAAAGAPGASSDLPALAPSLPGSLTLYLLEDDEDVCTLITEQLRPFGYHVVAHRTPDGLLEALGRELPSALLLDVALDAGVRGTQVALELPDEVRENVPLVFLSVLGDLQSRVEATRAGAAAYLEKPVDVHHLADLLDRLTRTEAPDPLRVLVVEDEEETAALYSAALLRAGMVTRTAGEAREAMAALLDFGPEIILLDLYLPGIRGDELAQVIRQQGAFQSIPIVFVSAEQDEERQMRALGFGGDDFLAKPVDLHTLTSSVRIRAERYRLLRASMQRDGLTGLLNHRHAKEALETELVRAERSDAPLSVAMVDIDHFKTVNDTWGHPVGDRVLRSLSRILTQRLRRSDVIGRYGGEEFLVVMPDTPVDQAAKVLDELRASFATVVHSAGHETFSRTMSCGVVESRAGERESDVLARADAVLYEAKEGGRDRVVQG